MIELDTEIKQHKSITVCWEAHIKICDIEHTLRTFLACEVRERKGNIDSRAFCPDDYKPYVVDEE